MCEAEKQAGKGALPIHEYKFHSLKDSPPPRKKHQNKGFGRTEDGFGTKLLPLVPLPHSPVPAIRPAGGAYQTTRTPNSCSSWGKNLK